MTNLSLGVKNFIRKYIDLIDKEDFSMVYAIASNELEPNEIGELTDVFYASGIDPLENEALKTIPIYYLYNSQNIDSLMIPQHIEEVFALAFKNSSLRKINLANIQTIETQAFMNTPIQEVDLSKVKHISGSAFEGCGELMSIKLGSPLTVISRRAFSGCYKLKDIFYEGTTKEWSSIHLTAYWRSTLSPITLHCKDVTVTI